HEVEAAVESAERADVAAHEVDARLTRTAGVHEQRADADRRLSRGLAHQRERHLAALRVRVVERNLQRAALKARATVRPRDFGGSGGGSGAVGGAGLGT